MSRVVDPCPARERPAAAITVEAVAARLLAACSDGTMLTLWSKTDLGRLLSRPEKASLDAALMRLQADGRLVALAHGSRVWFAFADALRARLAVAPGPVSEKLPMVYRRLVRESGGFPDVKISVLARALEPSAARGLPERLKAMWRAGEATLSLGDWSLASEETRAAAVEMDGEKYLLVRFEAAAS